MPRHGSSHQTWVEHYDWFYENELERDVADLDVAFRVTGKQPELWDAVSGTRRDLCEFRTENDRTVIRLVLAPSGSSFIVFRRPVSEPNGGKNIPESQKVMDIEGPWTVAFDPKWGGPEEAIFPTLEDWIERPEPGIKYYSGRATYRKKFYLPEALNESGARLFLELGRLRCLAEVRLNGSDLGVIWCAPWRLEITGLVKETGNELEVDIVNLWPNRLIGDLDKPEDERLSWTSLNDTIRAFEPGAKLLPSGLYGPVSIISQKA